jgi:DNA-binding transcriptional ArsR family regulator
MLAEPRRTRRTDLAPLWKALSDPTRRAILDRLREGPLTTGAIADLFPSSRFAVMKHLRVLADAGLVLSTREGRERWNTLNAVPLQQLYERWVRPYEAHWASGLLRLKHATEKGEWTMPGAVNELTTSGLVRVAVEVPVQAPVARVWKTLTERPEVWWPTDFFSSPRAMRMRLEPKLGGLLYEDWGEGAGFVWATIIGLNPPASLDMVGHMAAGFGGPATTIVRIELLAAESGTVVRLTDAVMGHVSEDSPRHLREGWTAILTSLGRTAEA